jgi:ATP-dependent Clp endopeptidase proteolytic subunit ClpP
MNRFRLYTALRTASAPQSTAGSWYRIARNQTPSTTGDGGVTIFIYDEIGYYGITADDFVQEIMSLQTMALTVCLNTPGGEIFDGIAIHNALRAHPASVTTVVDSLAASIGSVILQAGDDGQRMVRPYCQVMIHEGRGVCVGDPTEMREEADLLDRLSGTIASVYADRSGVGTPDTWRAAMRAETWYSAQEAVDAGLADAILTAPVTGTPIEVPEAPEESGGAGPMGAGVDGRLIRATWRYRSREEAPGPVPTLGAEPAPVVDPVPAPPVDDSARLSAEDDAALVAALKGALRV